MQFYDTLSRHVREFLPLEPGRASMYTCGPTVYRHAHIGNLRSYITADLLRRALELNGNKVTQIVNITDVGHMTDDVREAGEDKMLLAVEDEGLSPGEIAAKYTEAFQRHCRIVGVQEAASYPKATDHIAEMIEIISKLLKRGHAYEVNGTVYFDVDSFERYGRLSHNTRDHLRAGHRDTTVDPNKRNHYDFTLWRAAGPRRLMKWPSPWGEGYPGWHIECSAMSMQYLGEQFDIHTGGSDNIFPHHEDEIAQSEGATGHEVVRYWLHGHHLLAEGRKMAKSEGNHFTADDLLERGHDPLAFRYLMLQARYRSQNNFTWDALEAAGRGLVKMRRQVAEWPGENEGPGTDAAREIDTSFMQRVADDLDTPGALEVFSTLASAEIDPADKFGLVIRWDSVLGLDLARETTASTDLPEGALARIEAREKARAAGDYARADKLRDELNKSGVEVIDTSRGPRWAVHR